MQPRSPPTGRKNRRDLKPSLVQFAHRFACAVGPHDEREGSVKLYDIQVVRAEATYALDQELDARKKGKSTHSVWVRSMLCLLRVRSAVLAPTVLHITHLVYGTHGLSVHTMASACTLEHTRLPSPRLHENGDSDV